MIINAYFARSRAIEEPFQIVGNVDASGYTVTYKSLADIDVYHFATDAALDTQTSTFWISDAHKTTATRNKTTTVNIVNFYHTFRSKSALRLAAASSQYARTANNSITFSANFTWSVWFQTTVTNARQTILSVRNDTGQFRQLELFTDNRVHLYVSDAADGRRGSTSAVLTNQWYHVALTIDSDRSTFVVYFNGARAFEGTVPAADFTSTLAIGCRDRAAGPDAFFSGDIDEVAVFSAPLNDSHVADLYAGGAPSNVRVHTAQAALRAWYSFENHSLGSTTVTDKSGFVTPAPSLTLLNGASVAAISNVSYISTVLSEQIRVAQKYYVYLVAKRDAKITVYSRVDTYPSDRKTPSISIKSVGEAAPKIFNGIIYVPIVFDAADSNDVVVTVHAYQGTEGLFHAGNQTVTLVGGTYVGRIFTLEKVFLNSTFVNVPRTGNFIVLAKSVDGANNTTLATATTLNVDTRPRILNITQAVPIITGSVGTTGEVFVTVSTTGWYTYRATIFAHASGTLSNSDVHTIVNSATFLSLTNLSRVTLEYTSPPTIPLTGSLSRHVSSTGTDAGVFASFTTYYVYHVAHEPGTFTIVSSDVRAFTSLDATPPVLADTLQAIAASETSVEIRGITASDNAGAYTIYAYVSASGTYAWPGSTGAPTFEVGTVLVLSKTNPISNDTAGSVTKTVEGVDLSTAGGPYFAYALAVDGAGNRSIQRRSLAAVYTDTTTPILMRSVALNVDGVRSERALSSTGSTYAQTPGNSGTTSLLRDKDFTWTAWFRSSQTSRSVLMSIKSSSNTYRSIELEGERVYVTQNDQRRPTTGQSFVIATSNTWYHIAFVIEADGRTCNVYMDGGLANFTIFAAEMTSSGPFTIGARGTSIGAADLPFQGLIDDVGIYNVALTPAQVSAMFTSTKAPTDLRVATFAANLVAYYRFETDGATVIDATGRGNDLTVYNAAYAATNFDAGSPPQYGACSNLPLHDTSFTVSMWMRDVGGGIMQGALIMQHKADANMQQVVMSKTGGTIQFHFQSNVLTAAMVNDTLWHFLAFTYNRSTLRRSIYVDGTRVSADASNVGPLDLSGVSELFVGSAKPGATVNGAKVSSFRGYLHDLGVWYTALSDTEIRALYQGAASMSLTTNAGAYVSASSLQAYWKVVS